MGRENGRRWVDRAALQRVAGWVGLLLHPDRADNVAEVLASKLASMQGLALYMGRPELRDVAPLAASTNATRCSLQAPSMSGEASGCLASTRTNAPNGAITLRPDRVRVQPPVDAVDDSLARIYATEPKLRAFITIREDEAHDEAAAVRDGDLAGWPVAVKDNIEVANCPCTAGSRVFAEHRPTQDAEVVRLIRAAGAIVVGKANMHEFAWGGTSRNPHYGAVGNPRDLSRSPGGSSGGSAAAVAAGDCPAALGTDTAGSVRIPASLCGVVGLRPTQGLISTAGVIPLAWSMDTVGPIARTVRDCRTLFRVLAKAPCSPRSGEHRRLRVGTITDLSKDATIDVQTVVSQTLDALTGLGHIVDDLPALGVLDYIDPATFIVQAVEASAWQQELVQTNPDHYGDDVRTLLELGSILPAAYYTQAQRFRSALRASLVHQLGRVDAIAIPTVPFTAPPIKNRSGVGHHGAMLSKVAHFTGIASLCGLPALSIPCGAGDDGMPIGIQLIGALSGEETLFDLGEDVERVTELGWWVDQRLGKRGTAHDWY